MDLDAVQLRVLGCLIEKQRTTPDQYPLSVNSLRLACNQATNRHPVVEYDEPTIRAALSELSRRGLARLTSGPGSRAVKYRHLVDDALSLSAAESSVLAVLALRGAQTAAELKQRVERLHRFESNAEVTETLRALAERELTQLLPRRPGEREERWVQLLGDGGAPAASPSPTADAPPLPTAEERPDLEERVRRLEEAVAALHTRMAPEDA